MGELWDEARRRRAVDLTTTLTIAERTSADQLELRSAAVAMAKVKVEHNRLELVAEQAHAHARLADLEGR